MTLSQINVLKSRATLRHIEIVWSVYNTGSITKSAAMLEMTASNVSRTCSRFESHFEFPIYEKKRKGVRMTEQGIALMELIGPIAREIKSISAIIG